MIPRKVVSLSITQMLHALGKGRVELLGMTLTNRVYRYGGDGDVFQILEPSGPDPVWKFTCLWEDSRYFGQVYGDIEQFERDVVMIRMAVA